MIIDDTGYVLATQPTQSFLYQNIFVLYSDVLSRYIVKPANISTH